MVRTNRRPIPTGKLKPGTALLISVCLIFLGSVILFFGTNLTALWLGLFAVLWYNGVYTPLKRKTAFAVIPGSLIGAIPPAVGWVTGGSSILDPRILVVGLFFFIWQIPHFWLLLLNHGEDYERAGFPSLTKIFNIEQLARITFMWIVATSVTCLLIPIFHVVNSHLIDLVLVVVALWLVWTTAKILRAKSQEFSFRFAFRGINIYALLVMSLLSLDKFLS